MLQSLPQGAYPANDAAVLFCWFFYATYNDNSCASANCEFSCKTILILHLPAGCIKHSMHNCPTWLPLLISLLKFWIRFLCCCFPTPPLHPIHSINTRQRFAVGLGLYVSFAKIIQRQCQHMCRQTTGQSFIKFISQLHASINTTSTPTPGATVDQPCQHCVPYPFSLYQSICPRSLPCLPRTVTAVQNEPSRIN